MPTSECQERREKNGGEGDGKESMVVQKPLTAGMQLCASCYGYGIGASASAQLQWRLFLSINYGHTCKLYILEINFVEQS